MRSEGTAAVVVVLVLWMGETAVWLLACRAVVSLVSDAARRSCVNKQRERGQRQNYRTIIKTAWEFGKVKA